MKERRRLAYNFSVRAAPPFAGQIPLREEHRPHPQINFGYQEVFDVLGGLHNLGVSVSLFYSEHVLAFFRTDRDFKNTTTQPAFLWSYRTYSSFWSHGIGPLFT